MNCQEVSELMQRYLDQDLSEKEHEQLLDHIRSCTSCAELFERLKHLSAHLENLPKVAPPVSLVDQILPRLEEIEQMRESAERGENDTAVRSVFKDRVKRVFNYKTLGGVVAAGIVFALFWVNNPLKTWENADQLLQPETAGSTEHSMSAAGSREAAGAQESAGANPQGEKIMASENADAQANHHEASLKIPAETDLSAASPDRNTSAPGGNAASAAEKDKTVKESLPGNGQQDNAASGETGRTFSFRAADSGSADKAGQQQSGQERAGQQQPGRRTDAANSAAISAIPPAAEQEAGIAGIAGRMSTMSGQPEEPVASPDGQYAAYVKTEGGSLQVVIVDSGQNIVFISPAKEAERIFNLAWSQDSRLLEYDAAQGGQVVHYTIDVEKRTEK
jgi:hypothetical protein